MNRLSSFSFSLLSFWRHLLFNLIDRTRSFIFAVSSGLTIKYCWPRVKQRLHIRGKSGVLTFNHSRSHIHFLGRINNDEVTMVRVHRGVSCKQLQTQWKCPQLCTLNRTDSFLICSKLTNLYTGQIGFVSNILLPFVCLLYICKKLYSVHNFKVRTY